MNGLDSLTSHITQILCTINHLLYRRSPLAFYLLPSHTVYSSLLNPFFFRSRRSSLLSARCLLVTNLPRYAAHEPEHIPFNPSLCPCLCPIAACYPPSIHAAHPRFHIYNVNVKLRSVRVRYARQDVSLQPSSLSRVRL